MRRPADILATLAMASGLAACQSTAGGEYPSLAVRDVERVEGQFETVSAPPLDVPAVPVAFQGTLERRLYTVTNDAQSAHKRFLAMRDDAARIAAAASGAGVGSDAWASAQVALSDLDSIRSDTAIALADLDILAIAAAVQAQERAAIDAARAEVLALVSEEDRTLAELRARIR